MGGMLLRDRFDHFLSHVSKRHHAHSLPDSETDAWRDSAVQAPYPTLRIYVPERAANTELCGAIGIGLLALHFYPNHLDGLVPARQSTSNARGQYLLNNTESLLSPFVVGSADRIFNQSREAEPRPPIGDLPNCYSIDSFVNSSQSLRPKHRDKCLQGTRGFQPRCRLLLSSNFRCLHTGTEPDRCVCLGRTTDHASCDAGQKLGGPDCPRMILDFGGHKEQNRAFRGRFNPGPWD